MASEVRLISELGEQLGVVPIDKAKSYATSKGLDLIEVSSNTTPPVVKVESLSKFKFELLKREKQAKKKSKVKEMKEMWFQPLIGKKEMEHKLERVREFLDKKHNVKIVVRMHGRINYEMGKDLMLKIIESLQDCSVIDTDPKFESKQIITIVRPGKLVQNKIN